MYSVLKKELESLENQINNYYEEVEEDLQMYLSTQQQTKIIQKIINKIRIEIQMAVENDTLEEVLEKYSVSLEDDEFAVNLYQYQVHYQVILMILLKWQKNGDWQ